MSILSLERWKPVPGHVGYEVSSRGRVRHNGRYLKADGGMLTIGNNNYRVDRLLDKLFTPNPNAAAGWRQLLLLRKPSAAFQRFGNGQALVNRRKAIPLKPGP